LSICRIWGGMRVYGTRWVIVARVLPPRVIWVPVWVSRYLDWMKEELHLMICPLTRGHFITEYPGFWVRPYGGIANWIEQAYDSKKNCNLWL
jgi:hypothetical protein